MGYPRFFHEAIITADPYMIWLHKHNNIRTVELVWDFGFDSGSLVIGPPDMKMPPMGEIYSNDNGCDEFEYINYYVESGVYLGLAE